MRWRPLLVPLLVVALLVGGAALYKYALSIRGRAMAAQLEATTIDLTVIGISAESAFRTLEEKLKSKNAYFQTCVFEYAVSPPTHAQVTFEAPETSGMDGLLYVTDLCGLRYHLRPGKVVVTHPRDDLRDPVERAIDATVNWFSHAARWTQKVFGSQPPTPVDPFAPPPEPPPFPFDRVSR